jgi:hypothetical protein
LESQAATDRPAHTLEACSQQKEDAMAVEAGMSEMQVHDYARQMLDARGDKALAEAAYRAQTCESDGHGEEANIWRKIEAALKLMRGPHQG